MDPLKVTNKNTFFTYGLLLMLSPVLTELVLVIRILAVFPPHHTPQHKLALALAPTTILKIARFVTIGLFFREYYRALDGPGSSADNDGSYDSQWRDTSIRLRVAPVFFALFDDASV